MLEEAIGGGEVVIVQDTQPDALDAALRDASDLGGFDRPRSTIPFLVATKGSRRGIGDSEPN